MRFFGLSLFLFGFVVVTFGLLLTYDISSLPWLGRDQTLVNFTEDEEDFDQEQNNDDEDARDEAALLTGSSVHFSAAAQTLSGVQVKALSAVDFRPELKAFGRVVDIEPMVSLRLRYDKARLAGSKALLDNIRIQAELEWGPILAAALFDEKSQFLQSVAEGRQVLVQVTLPLGESLKGQSAARLYRNGEEDRPIAADYISPAPRIDPAIQGETHFYQATTERLRTGMAVDVAVISNALSLRGVFIPEAAVIWRDGRAWMYRQTAPQRFERVGLPTEYKAVAGWFAERPDWAGMDVVVVGAQILLSEEFRTHLGDDDDD